MPPRFLFLGLIWLFFGCQDYGSLIKIQHLPPIMKEVSGMEKNRDSETLWMINDSGNKNEIYGLVPGQTSLRNIKIENATNKDWEDLAKDRDGNFYIGDFGNNKNKRKDLVIYKIKKPDNISAETTTAEKIHFSLEDQEEFPPKKNLRNFDIEAFVHFNNSLYLFSKNRSSSSDGISKIYRLPDQPGNYNAKLIGKFQSCSKSTCRITGATISEDEQKIFLLTHDVVYVLRNFKKDDFTNIEVKKLELGHTSQKESICLKNENTLYLADEQTAIEGRNLYEFPLE